MSVQLNHTIVRCRDRRRSATFLSQLLGRADPVRFGPFLVVELDNGCSLDFHETDEKIASQHYAFLIGEAEFDQVFGRIKERALDYWADLGRSGPHARARDQPQRRRSRALLPGSGWPPARSHHPPLRQRRPKLKLKPERPVICKQRRCAACVDEDDMLIGAPTAGARKLHQSRQAFG